MSPKKKLSEVETLISGAQVRLTNPESVHGFHTWVGYEMGRLEHAAKVDRERHELLLNSSRKFLEAAHLLTDENGEPLADQLCQCDETKPTMEQTCAFCEFWTSVSICDSALGPKGEQA